jgi:di/tricarboxylate transporter
MVAMAPVGPFPFLLLIFLFTSLLSCIVSNAATVVLLYSVLRTVEVEGLRPAQLMLVMMLGASSAFATPIGYQTNLMVLARGGYRFGDFAILGGGLTVVTGVSVASVVWALPESILGGDAMAAPL